MKNIIYFEPSDATRFDLERFVKSLNNYANISKDEVAQAVLLTLSALDVALRAPFGDQPVEARKLTRADLDVGEQTAVGMPGSQHQPRVGGGAVVNGLFLYDAGHKVADLLHAAAVS